MSIRRPPLNVTIFVAHVSNSVKGAMLARTFAACIRMLSSHWVLLHYHTSINWTHLFPNKGSQVVLLNIIQIQTDY